MKLKFNILSFVLTFGMMAVSCSDSSDWAPGPEDNDCGVSAYFPSQSSYRYIYGADEKPENMNIVVTVKRVDTADAVSVPVEVSTSCEGFSVPATVDFAAGESESSIIVSCKDIPQGEMQNITLTLAQNETDIYGPGVTSLSLEAIISEWKLISDNVTYYYMDADGKKAYPNTYGEMYHLEGTYMFRLTDFFASGLEMPFEMPSSEKSYFVPSGNYDIYANTYPEDAYECWYLYDEATSSYPAPWIPGGDQNQLAIEYALFYGTIDYCNITMLENRDRLYGYGNFTVNYGLSDGSWSSWGYNQIDFNLKYNPFK